MKLACNMDKIRYRSPDGRHSGRFNPSGPIRWSGPIPNALDHWTPELWSARVLLGFNVGDEPVWEMPDVTEWVKERRSRQGVDPDASFIYQKGIWTHGEGPNKGKSVTENSTQIVFLDLDEAEKDPEVFKNNILDLAQDMVRHFRQEKVFVDFQYNGLSKETVMVTP